jgi:hypothetical protein
MWQRLLSATKKPGGNRASEMENKLMLKSLFDRQENGKPLPHAVDTTANVLRSMVARSKNGVVHLAPGIAERILNELNFPEQRKIDTGRVYGHRHAIITGEWEEGHAITLVLLPDGRLWVVDGQHRLTAISQSDAPVAATIRIVPMDSEKDARHFYAGFDMRKSVRTDKQVLDAVGAAEECGLSDRMARAVYQAAPLLLNDLEPLTGSANIQKRPDMFLQHNKLVALQEWAAEARAYEKVIKPARKNLLLQLRSPGVLAVALYTMRHQPARAVEFWGGVAENDGLRKNDPRATLINDLLTRVLNNGSIRQRVQQPSLAWNAFCEGRDLKIIKCIDGSPITVWGTPLAKGRPA